MVQHVKLLHLKIHPNCPPVRPVEDLVAESIHQRALPSADIPNEDGLARAQVERSRRGLACPPGSLTEIRPIRVRRGQPRRIRSRKVVNVARSVVHVIVEHLVTGGLAPIGLFVDRHY